MQLAESPVKANLKGTCTGGTGPDLTGYPHLVYAPSQWGEGVRVGSNGHPVDHLAKQCEGSLTDLVSHATYYGVSLDALFDSLRYARANGLI